jgi:hypothetical protein
MARAPRRNHHSKHLTPEQRADINRANLEKSPGRPPGQRNVLPMGSVKAIEALKKGKFGVREEIKQKQGDELFNAAAEIAGDALQRTHLVLMGKVNGKKAPSTLKAAELIRREFCDPVVTESRVQLTGIANAVAQANSIITGKK